MRVIFLDIDGVLNSYQSSHFFHFRRDQDKAFKKWGGTLREFLGQEFDPIAISNLEDILREVPRIKIVISSTWRMGETTKSLKKIFDVSPLIASRIIGKTPRSRSGIRGREIQWWLDHHKAVEDFVIIDDDSDMAHLRGHLFQTSAKVGLDWHCRTKIINYFLASKPKRLYYRTKNATRWFYRRVRFHAFYHVLGSKFIGRYFHEATSPDPSRPK